MPLDVLGGLVEFADFVGVMGGLFRPEQQLDKGDRERALRAVLFVFSADDRVSEKEVRHLHRDHQWMPEASRTELDQLIDDIVADLKGLDDVGRAEYAVKLAKEMPPDETVRRETLIATAMAAAADLDGLLKQRAAHEHLALLMDADSDAIDLEARERLGDAED